MEKVDLGLSGVLTWAVTAKAKSSAWFSEEIGWDEHSRHVFSPQVIKRVFKFRQDLQGRSCKERWEQMDDV